MNKLVLFFTVIIISSNYFAKQIHEWLSLHANLLFTQ